LETRKNRPENLPPNVKWIVCRNCDKGIEVIGDDVTDVGTVTAMSYEETVTVTRYVTIKKSKKGVRKFTYSLSGKNFLYSLRTTPQCPIIPPMCDKLLLYRTL